MATPRIPAVLFAFFLALSAGVAPCGAQRIRGELGPSGSGASESASAVESAPFLAPVLSGALSARPAGASPLAAAPFVSAPLSPVAAANAPAAVAGWAAAPPRLVVPENVGAELPASAIPGSGGIGAPLAGAKPSGPASAGLEGAAAVDPNRFDGDALFDARRLQADDSINLILSGYRLDEASGRLLAPKTGAPVTNAQARELRNMFRESRSRRALLRLARTNGPGSAASRSALIEADRDALPREVLKASRIGPEKEQATILRRLTSLYRRWIERAPAENDGIVSPADAEAEEKLGALVSAAVVKRFEGDEEGRWLLGQLRDEHGELRLPTMRVLRLDARYGALYSPYGRQLILSLAYLKPLLLASLPEAERAEAAKSLETESGALAYLSQNPARVAALAEGIDVAVFHELVHFRQDLQRPLMAAQGREEAVGFTTYEREYEAFFHHVLYVHSRLSHPDAKIAIDRLDDYLRFIDSFDSWKNSIDQNYAANFLSGTVATEELARLQGDSQSLIQRLAGPEGGRSAAASDRVKAAARGTAAVAIEKKAAEAELADYRKRWPGIARDGLRRWAELNESAGRLPQAALAQERLARLAQSTSEAASWRKKSEESVERALARLESPEGLGLDERVAWVNALAAYAAERGEPYKRGLWVASFRDFAEKGRALREAAAKAASEPERLELIRQAGQFEGVVQANRVALRSWAETDLSATFAEKDPARRGALLARGFMEAEVLGDAALVEAFKPLARDATAEGWSKISETAADKALARLASGEGPSLDQRIAWINALVAFVNGRGELFKRELWTASFRDFAEKARALREKASAAGTEPERLKLIAQAEQFEGTIQTNRTVLRGRAEADLASAFAEKDPARRAAALARGFMEADVLGDAALAEAFKPLAQDATADGWSKNSETAADKALIRLAAGAGLSLDQKIAWIDGLTAYANARGEPWKEELWVALFRDYAEKAKELRAAAASAQEPAKGETLRSAERFERGANSKRAQLRGFAEANLAAARAEADPEHRKLLIEWGSMQAGALGDAPLLASFRALAAGAATSAAH